MPTTPTRLRFNGATYHLIDNKRRIASMRAETYEDIILASEAKERAVAPGIDLRGKDLSELWLNYAFLRGANLQGVNFTNAELHEANLTDSKIQGANFTGVDLRWVELDGAEYDDVTTWPRGFDPKRALKGLRYAQGK